MTDPDVSHTLFLLDDVPICEEPYRLPQLVKAQYGGKRRCQECAGFLSISSSLMDMEFERKSRGR